MLFFDISLIIGGVILIIKNPNDGDLLPLVGVGMVVAGIGGLFTLF